MFRSLRLSTFILVHDSALGGHLGAESDFHQAFFNSSSGLVVFESLQSGVAY